MTNPRNIPIKAYERVPERTTEIEFMQTIFSTQEKMNIETGTFYKNLCLGFDVPSLGYNILPKVKQ